MADLKNPKLREDIELFPVQSSGTTIIAIRDRLGLVEEGKGLNPGVYKLLSMLDGQRSVKEIQLELIRQHGGNLASLDKIEEALKQLDSLFLLDTPRYRESRDEIINRFRLQKVRYSSHAGISYPASKDELNGKIREILESVNPPEYPAGKIKALIAPHIDLNAGKRVYSNAYQAIRGTRPKRVIILGVGHSMSSDIFSLTEKAFQTPLGNVETDLDIIRELSLAGSQVTNENDFFHRDEHSIEFQILFLQYLLRGERFRIIPVLCGSLIAVLPEYSRAAYKSVCGDFLEVLADAAAEDDALVIAGVDFSHIGPKFGHEMPASCLSDQSERHDRQLLKSLCEMDADSFWAESINVRDRFNVCGFSALACLLEILPTSKGHLLDYAIYRENSTKSAVSFSAAVFTI